MVSVVIGSILMLAVTVILAVSLALFMSTQDMDQNKVDFIMHGVNTCVSLNNSCKVNLP